jgi:opine dehydrogenase
VRLWRRDARRSSRSCKPGDHAEGCGGRARGAVGTGHADIAAALKGAELIVIPTPAIAQHDIALAMAPHLVDGQVVFLPPGTFGSYVMARTVKEAGNRADVAWAETGTLPYLARKHGEREVNVTIRAIRLPTGVYPARKEAEAIAVIRKAYPAVHGCGDALSGALMNAGPVIHPPLMVMNAAPLQHFERWDIHNEGTQRAVRDVTDRLDRERMAVREAFGQGAPHYPLADHYNNDRGCTATRTSSWSSRATGARTSTCTRTATSPKTPNSAWPSSPRPRAMRAWMRPSRTACWPSWAAFSAATCAMAPALSKAWGSPT